MVNYILVSITIALCISFSLMFLMYFFSNDPRTMENLHMHPFFSSKLESGKTSIFLLGHSHVGQLNTTKINQMISENYDNYDVYNLAMYHDTPSSRIEQIDDIINLHPKMVFYGIAIADFLGPCKYSGDCNLNKKDNFILPNPKDFLDMLEIKKSLGLEQINPKFTTLEFVRNIFSGSTLFSEQGRRLDLGNTTPFYVIDDTYTRITSDTMLKNLVKESSSNMITVDSIKKSDETKYLKEIIKKLQENNIKIVLFKTPHHRFYIENIPESAINDYNNVLDEISKEFNVSVYDFFEKYADDNIWVDLEHVSYNKKAVAYTDDVTKMILMEIKK